MLTWNYLGILGHHANDKATLRNVELCDSLSIFEHLALDDELEAVGREICIRSFDASLELFHRVGRFSIHLEHVPL